MTPALRAIFVRVDELLRAEELRAEDLENLYADLAEQLAGLTPETAAEVLHELRPRIVRVGERMEEIDSELRKLQEGIRGIHGYNHLRAHRVQQRLNRRA